MVRMVLGSLLALLVILMIFSSPPKAEEIVPALIMLFLPGALLFYFGWHAHAARKRVVHRPHAVLVWGVAFAGLFALFAIFILVAPNQKDRGAAFAGLTLVAGLPAVALLLSGWPVSPAVLKPRAMRDVEKAAWEAEAARPGIMGSGICAICGSPDAVSHYFYFPPVNVAYSGDFRTKRVTYNSAVNKGVSFCERCVDRKRASLQPLMWLGVLISLPLCIFLVGVFGVLGFGMALAMLYRREETGDVMAYHWRTERKIRAGLTTMNAVTRRGFNKLAARQGPQWQGGLLTK
ncbi:MAG TPA: hypothetical protein VG323_07840 [Thermoanaerobaculia bacterium]|nr:hypothetical protein [Thermoanaerobaculia bacterium]